jgi:copper chaperone CopZ
MKTENLKFLGTLDEGIALAVAHTLSAIKGVAKVSVSTANRSIAVDFDDNATSLQEINTTLNKAGFPVRRPTPDGHGSCCGGCGGGH